jgi:xylulose-5-phosphate/fructose-6-phosphate phosphoketolase
MDALMAAALDQAVEEIQNVQHQARQHGETERPPWLMIVLNSPKGWAGPKEVDGQPIEGNFRAHGQEMPEILNWRWRAAP